MENSRQVKPAGRFGPVASCLCYLNRRYCGAGRGRIRRQHLFNEGSLVKNNRVHRLLRLITLLQAGTPLLADDLSSELGISRRTLFRDLQLMLLADKSGPRGMFPDARAVASAVLKIESALPYEVQ